MLKIRKKLIKGKPLHKRKLSAFTLQELMIVLIIIGILVLLALPRLMPLISKTKALEAQLQLNHVYSLQKNFFYMHSKYCDNLTDIDFEQETLVTDEGQANYIIEISNASTLGFTATATAVVDFDGDGSFNIWQIDQNKNLKEITKD